jgi:hypothetical protein
MTKITHHYVIGSWPRSHQIRKMKHPKDSCQKWSIFNYHQPSKKNNCRETKVFKFQGQFRQSKVRSLTYHSILLLDYPNSLAFHVNTHSKTCSVAITHLIRALSWSLNRDPRPNHLIYNSKNKSKIYLGPRQIEMKVSSNRKSKRRIFLYKNGLTTHLSMELALCSLMDKSVSISMILPSWCLSPNQTNSRILNDWEQKEVLGATL